MTNGTLTVVDGLVIGMQAEIEGYGEAVVPNEPLYKVLRKIAKFGWKTQGEVPQIFQPGQKYTTNVMKA